MEEITKKLRLIIHEIFNLNIPEQLTILIIHFSVHITLFKLIDARDTVMNTDNFKKIIVDIHVKEIINWQNLFKAAKNKIYPYYKSHYDRDLLICQCNISPKKLSIWHGNTLRYRSVSCGLFYRCSKCRYYNYFRFIHIAYEPIAKFTFAQKCWGINIVLSVDLRS